MFGGYHQTEKDRDMDELYRKVGRKLVEYDATGISPMVLDEIRLLRAEITALRKLIERKI